MFGPGVRTIASATAANPTTVAEGTISRSLDMHVARDRQHGMTRHLHPVAFQAQPELAAAAGKLPRKERLSLHHRRPIRHKKAMGRAGHGVFRDADLRHEHARDEIRLRAARGYD